MPVVCMDMPVGCASLFGRNRKQTQWHCSLQVARTFDTKSSVGPNQLPGSPPEPPDRPDPSVRHDTAVVLVAGCLRLGACVGVVTAGLPNHLLY